MDTNLLRSFVTVAELGSFTDAATHLNASQSTISGHISRLEEQLQTQLFSRTTRRCDLTVAGTALTKYALEVLSSLDRLEDNFVPSRLGGTIRVGVPDDHHLFSVMAPAMQSFRLARPNVVLKVDAGLSENHRRALRDGHLDLAILRQPVDAGATEVLGHSRLVWIASRSLDLDTLDILPIAHVNEPCLYFKAVGDALRANGIQWREVYSCSTLEGVRAAVKFGMAVSAIPEHDVDEQSLRVSHPKLPDLPNFCVVSETASSNPPVLVRSLLASLASVLRLNVVDVRPALNVPS